MNKETDLTRRNFLRTLGAIGLGIATGEILKTNADAADEAHAATIAEAAQEYKFNAAEMALIRRYHCNTLKEASGKLILYVVDTQPSRKFGRFWSIVHPGKNPEYDEHWRAVMKSHNNSKTAYAKFEEAWQNRTASMLSELTKICPKPKPNEFFELPKGYPIENYAAMLTYFPKRNADGTIQYGINKAGERAPLLEDVGAYVPVKVENNKLAVINIFALTQNAQGEWDYEYRKGASGNYVTDAQGKRVRVWSKDYVDFKDKLDNVASRRVYNRMYVNNPPPNTLLIMDDNGVLLHRPFSDGSATLGTIRDWFEECKIECDKVEIEALRVPLKDFYIVMDIKKNIFEPYMYLRDEKGNITGKVPVHQERMPPELKKAIRIIEKKEPFVPKESPKPQIELPKSSRVLTSIDHVGVKPSADPIVLAKQSHRFAQKPQYETALGNKIAAVLKRSGLIG